MANFFQNLRLTSYMGEIWLPLLVAFIFGFAFDMCCTLDTFFQDLKDLILVIVG